MAKTASTAKLGRETGAAAVGAAVAVGATATGVADGADTPVGGGVDGAEPPTGGAALFGAAVPAKSFTAPGGSLTAIKSQPRKI